MRSFLTVYMPALLFIVAIVAVFLWHEPLQIYLSGIVGDGGVLSYLAFVGILTGAVVMMPATAMPMIPIASMVLGPFITALLSIVGWTLGGLIAFLIARHVGRPILKYFVSLEELDKAVRKLPPDTQFLAVVLLRLTLPVDVVSYAIGLTSTIGVVPYTVATAIGVTWFSFAFAYLGGALYEGNTLVLLTLGGVSLAVFLGGWYVLLRSKRNNTE